MEGVSSVGASDQSGAGVIMTESRRIIINNAVVLRMRRDDRKILTQYFKDVSMRQHLHRGVFEAHLRVKSLSECIKTLAVRFNALR